MAVYDTLYASAAAEVYKCGDYAVVELGEDVKPIRSRLFYSTITKNMGLDVDKCMILPKSLTLMDASDADIAKALEIIKEYEKEIEVGREVYNTICDGVGKDAARIVIDYSAKHGAVASLTEYGLDRFIERGTVGSVAKKLLFDE